MTETDQIGFEMGCLIGFHIDSDELDLMLAKYGLDRRSSSLQECKDALRDHVGEGAYRKGVRRIKSRVLQENADWN